MKCFINSFKKFNNNQYNHILMFYKSLHIKSTVRVSDLAYLRTGHHHAIVEAQVKNRLTVVDKRVGHVSSVDIPYSDRGVWGAADDYSFIVL